MHSAYSFAKSSAFNFRQIESRTDTALALADGVDKFFGLLRVCFNTRSNLYEAFQVFPVRIHSGHDSRRFLVAAAVEGHSRPVGAAYHVFDEAAGPQTVEGVVFRVARVKGSLAQFADFGISHIQFGRSRFAEACQDVAGVPNSVEGDLRAGVFARMGHERVGNPEAAGMLKSFYARSDGQAVYRFSSHCHFRELRPDMTGFLHADHIGQQTCRAAKSRASAGLAAAGRQSVDCREVAQEPSYILRFAAEEYSFIRDEYVVEVYERLMVGILFAQVDAFDIAFDFKEAFILRRTT